MSKNRDDVIRKLEYETSRLLGEHILAKSDGEMAKAEQLKREFEQVKEQLRRLEQNEPSEDTTQNNKQTTSSSNSSPTTTSTSKAGEKRFESLGPLPMVNLNAPDGPQRLKRVMMRRLAKGLIRRGTCPSIHRPWPPEVADIEALYFPPMKDETHLMDGRTLKEAWPELEAQIMALPDD